MGKCSKCGIYGIEGDICCMCEKYGDNIFIISDDLNRKHIKEDDKCEGCNDFYFKDDLEDSFEIQFPIIHENCNGLIHLDRITYSDGYSTDINLIFQCKKCGIILDTWTEGELIDNEFKKKFYFIPKNNTI